MSAREYKWVGLVIPVEDWKDWLDYCQEHQVSPDDEIRRIMKEEIYK